MLCSVFEEKLMRISNSLFANFPNLLEIFVDSWTWHFSVANLRCFDMDLIFNLFQKIWKLTHSEEQEFSDVSVNIFKSQLTSLSLHCIHIHYTNVFEWLYRMTFRIMLLFKVIILHSVKLWNVGWLILSEHPNKLLKYIAVSIYVNYNKLFNFWSTNILVKLLLISLNLYQFHASSHAGHFSVIFNNYLRCFKGFFKITLVCSIFPIPM